MSVSSRFIYSVSGLLITLLLVGFSFDGINQVKADENTQPAVLELLLKETPKPNYGVPVPEQIKGSVKVLRNGDSIGVEGISISDGYSTVKTNAQGAYTIIPKKDSVFINLTRPSGYDIQGDWYKPLAAQVDFELKPAAEEENEFVFVHVTDTHVSTNPRSVEGLSQFVRERS